MTLQNLEEIFWKNGKFVNGKEKVIKPEPVGLPSLVINLKDKEISREHPIFEKENLEIKGRGIKAYSKNIYRNVEQSGYSASIQFYKI